MLNDEVLNATNKINDVNQLQEQFAEKIYDLAHNFSREEVDINNAILSLFQAQKQLLKDTKPSQQVMEFVKALIGAFNVSSNNNNIRTLLEDADKKIEALSLLVCKKNKTQQEKDKAQEEINSNKEKLIDVLQLLINELSDEMSKIRVESIGKIKDELPTIVETAQKLEQASAESIYLGYAALSSQLLKQEMFDYFQKVFDKMENYIYAPLQEIKSIQASQFEEAYNKRAKVIIEFPKDVTYGLKKRYNKVIFIEPCVSDVANSTEYYQLDALAKVIEPAQAGSGDISQLLEKVPLFWKFINNTSLLRNEDGGRISVEDFHDCKLDTQYFFLGVLLMLIKNSDFLRLKERFGHYLEQRQIIINGLSKT